MNRDLERRLRRVEAVRDPDAVRYDVSSVPLYDGQGNRLLPPLDPEPDREMTEAEWTAAYCAWAGLCEFT